MRDFEEFLEAIEALIDEQCTDRPPFYWIGDSPVYPNREEGCRKVWDRLGLQDYVDRVYMLQRDDVRNTARNELGLDLDAIDLPEDFWHDVEKGIESGLSCWSEIVRTAIEEALDST